MNFTYRKTSTTYTNEPLKTATYIEVSRNGRVVDTATFYSDGLLEIKETPTGFIVNVANVGGLIVNGKDSVIKISRI
jgi:hypothetical protein